MWDDATHELALRVPERGGDLRRLAEGAASRTCSPLRDYVLRRLDGTSGPAWLDGQGIEQATRATEMLGALLAFGQTPDLDAFTPDDWDRAGRAGFDVTSRGEEAITGAPASVQSSYEEARGTSGSQKHFGRFHQWLEFASSDKDPGPIKAILRERILSTFEVEPGRTVLGEVLRRRRRHGVTSLGRSAGVYPLTLQNLLIARGLIPRETDRSSWRATVDAKEGERIAAAMKRAVPMIGLPRALGRTRPLTEQVVAAGIVILPDGSGTKCRGHLGRSGPDRRTAFTPERRCTRRRRGAPRSRGNREGGPEGACPGRGGRADDPGR